MNSVFAAPSGDVVAPMEHCWRRIGIDGDRSCPELTSFIHCRNCPVVAAAARLFFDRRAPAGYLEAWGEVLAHREAAVETDATSVLVFRLGDEWLALSTVSLVEVTTPRTVHVVPHRSEGVLAGIVNIRGRLHLCVRLARLLGLTEAVGNAPPPLPSARLLVVEHKAAQALHRWVFGVDEVAGVQRVPRNALGPVPSTVSGGAEHAAAALFAWRDRTVGLLDEARLLDRLHRMVSA